MTFLLVVDGDAPAAHDVPAAPAEGGGGEVEVHVDERRRSVATSGIRE